MLIVLVFAARVQQPRPRRQRRGHVDNRLTNTSKLLRQQRAHTGRAFDHPRREPFREPQQPITLTTVSAQLLHRDDAFVAVDHAAVCGPLCGSIPIMNTNVLLDQK
jgi:hypothetical protein